MEYSHKLVLEYFISAVGELQNGNFGFHTFGPFRKLTPHCADAPSTKGFCLYDIYTFFYMYTAPGLYAPFKKNLSQIEL